MNAVSRRLVMAVLVLGCAQTAAAQTADEIVEKYLTAIGGRAALGKLKSRSMVGTMTLSTPAGDVSGPVEILNQEPNKSRTLIKLDLSSLGAGQMILDQRFDETSGYALDSLRGNRDITGNQLENMKNVPQVGEVEQTTEFSDYRDVDGVKIPFTVKATSAV